MASTFATRRPSAVDLLWSAACLAVFLAPTIGRTQSPDAGSDAAEQVLEEIVVTGSRIVRRDFSSPSPVATIDRAAMESSGLPTLESSLNRMPQITPGFDRSSNLGDGTAQVNLRGLGANRTLVLLNGRRLAPSGVGSSFDVNNLPQALIDRVEVITGGATAVYGSDAVSGVVNFIMREDFNGIGLDASYYATGHGDSQSYDLNLSWGTDIQNGRGNLILFGSYYDRDATYAIEREFTQTPWVDDWEGNLYPGGSIATPPGVVVYADAADNAVFTTFTPDGNPVPFDPTSDLYNYAPANYLQIPLQRYSGGAFLNYDLGASIETYVELLASHNDVLRNGAPVPIFYTVFTNLDNPLLTDDTRQFFADNLYPADSPPWPPNTVAYGFRRRLLELGPRLTDKNTDYRRLVAGLRGDINDNWNYDAWVSYTTEDEDVVLSNDGSRSRLQQGMLVDPATGQCYDTSDGCVPLDLWGEGRLSAEGVAFIRVPSLLNTTSREQASISAFLRGSPMQTWAGDVQTAFGFDWRRDSGEFTADPALSTGDTLGYSGDAGVDGTESVYEIYGEALVPLARDQRYAGYLGLELGARYSHYDHAGSVETHKLGANWELNDNILFRGMFQHSVRAPNLYEAFQEQYHEEFTFSVPSSPDPCSASQDPVGTGNREKCIATGLPADQVGVFESTWFYPTDFVYGGNPELEPEQADSLTLGVVTTFDALAEWQVSVDYFDIRLEDAIGGLDASVVCFDPLNTANLFCGNITRDPNNYNVVGVYQPSVNRGVLHTEGVDTQVNFGMDLPGYLAVGADYARLDVHLYWTHVMTNSQQAFDGGTTWECAGKFGYPCFGDESGGTFPDDKVTTSFDYSAGDLFLNLTWRWLDGTHNAEAYVAPLYGYDHPVFAVPTVATRSYVDFGVGYHFGETVDLRLTVANLFDEQPPMMADAVYIHNTDTSMYDVFGRSFSLKVSCRLFE